MIKEVAMHKAMIAFRMLFRQPNVLIHVEGDNMLKANLACFVHLNQGFISGQRRTAGRQAQDKRTVRSRFERIDAVNDMPGSPFTDLFSCYQGDQSHCSPL